MAPEKLFPTPKGYSLDCPTPLNTDANIGWGEERCHMFVCFIFLERGRVSAGLNSIKEHRYYLCMLCVFAGRGLCDGPITRPGESYRV